MKYYYFENNYKNKIQPSRKIHQVCYDIDHEIIRSLKNGEHDYCYLYSDFQDSINYIKNYLEKHSGFSVIYKIYHNKYGTFDYGEFIPVKCYDNNDIEVKGKIYSYDQIPNNLKCIEKNRYMTIIKDRV